MIMLLVTMLGAFAVASPGVPPVASGWASPGGGLDVLYVFYYGVVCFLQALFDTVLCIERALTVRKYHYFDSSAPMMHNFASAIFIVCPLVEFASACLCYVIFKQTDDMYPQLLPPPEHYHATPSGGSAPARSEPPPTHFTGKAYKLSGVSSPCSAKEAETVA